MPNIRRAFIRKTITLVGFQFIFTIILVIIGMNSKRIKDFQSKHIFLLIIFIFIEVVCMILIFCYKEKCRIYPYNYIIFCTFTFAVSYVLSFICARLDPVIVLSACAGSSVYVFCLATYSYFSKCDFTSKVGLFISLPIIVGIITVFFGG